ncbi:MAG: CHRD domain-containing protein [Acidimicrobiales bacterium]
MKRLLALLTVVAMLAVFVVASSNAGATDRSVFLTRLSGMQEVPVVDTDAGGFALFSVNDEAETIRYTIWGDDIFGVTEAHLHVGDFGMNGGVAAFLFNFNGDGVDPGNGIGTVSGEFYASGTVTYGDVAKFGAFADVGELIDAVRSGDIYVNVHTVDNPGGEIRGQIF